MAKAAKKAATAAPKKAAAKKETAAPKKAAPKKAAAKKAKGGDDKKSGGKAANAGLMKPLNVSPELAKVVGKDPLPRTEIIKKIWDYIKANNLQDSENRRNINADETLKPVFAKDQVTMFELAKIVNNHVKQ